MYARIVTRLPSASMELKNPGAEVVAVTAAKQKGKVALRHFPNSARRQSSDYCDVPSQ